MQLRTEINRRWPGRSKALDGTIGDAAHRARVSEHNPDGLGVVRAMDIDASGIGVQELLDAVIGDDRVHYVIHNRKIYSRSNKWAARPYSGASSHTRHVHISLRNRTSEKASAATVAAAAGNTSAWFASSAAPGLPSAGGRGETVSLAGLLNAVRADPPKPGQTTTNWAAVLPVERALVAEGLLTAALADGHFGTTSIAAYAAWQRRCGYTGRDADGIPARRPWSASARRTTSRSWPDGRQADRR
ncbi:hypothetical protein G7085_12800 [Tessaracoccus sp. HDW20]|uniref:hypothetical protein n=1 Tax=Tessaracoccus coleopterorum TaxID=2714950 RepID=UPI0018D3FC07|nr:hypothetical protein [Tessaracoccus coleopterorum]NHB85204.1 hypothetical protein [Tessaracoccus coleopterorum]